MAKTKLIPIDGKKIRCRKLTAGLIRKGDLIGNVCGDWWFANSADVGERFSDRVLPYRPIKRPRKAKPLSSFKLKAGEKAVVKAVTFSEVRKKKVVVVVKGVKAYAGVCDDIIHEIFIYKYEADKAYECVVPVLVTPLLKKGRK